MNRWGILMLPVDLLLAGVLAGAVLEATDNPWFRALGLAAVGGGFAFFAWLTLASATGPKAYIQRTPAKHDEPEPKKD